MRTGGVRGLSGLGLLGAGTVGMGVALAAEAPLLLVVFALVGYAGECALRVWSPDLETALSRIGFDARVRSLARLALLLALFVATGSGGGWVLLAMTVLVGTRVLSSALAVMATRAGRLPVATRNVDMSGLGVPVLRSRPLSLATDASWSLTDAPLLLGGAVTLLAGSSVPVLAGGILSVLLAVLLAGAVAVEWNRARRSPTDARVMDHVQSWLRSHRPEVILYFTGSSNSAYQVNMWLRTVELLPMRGVVVLREHAVAEKLAETTLPVLCVPRSTDLMALDFDPARVALYPANAGKNIHMLRNPRMRHVFIGHGDSDKIASVNPFSKVYDMVWTAGQAGRDRYARAGVGIRDDEIVEVGRPQLAPVRTSAPARSTRTVLYAPTWEGWTDEPGNTSLIDAGPALVAALLAATPEVRVVYKPHPFTGNRSAAARRAHARIVSLLEQANGRVGDDAVPGEDDHFWSRIPEDRHVVIQGQVPSLYSCFNESALLISDISSVVADFVASGKPYAITNCEGTTDAEFREKHPTSRAAYLLTPEAGGLDTALAALTGSDTDPLREERRKLKEYLLGPDTPDAGTRFARAVADLYEHADREVGAELRTDTAVAL